MKTPLLIFFCFLLSLLIVQTLSLPELLGFNHSIRLTVICTLILPLYLLVRSAVKTLRNIEVTNNGTTTDIKPAFYAISGLLFLLLVYSWIMTEFGIAPFANFFYDYLLLLPLLLLLLPAYLKWANRFNQQTACDYHRLGLSMLGSPAFRFSEHKPLLLASSVKILFIPIMYGGLFESLGLLLSFLWQPNPTIVVIGLFLFGLSYDLIIATSGYVFAAKWLGTDVKSTDDSWSGWLVCMICYPPLLIIYRWISQQTDKVVWSDWLLPDTPVYWLWAALITLSWTTYWLSTASFGWRFSNLTWRGLVSHGPYRYSKHPAYIAKNIYWWMHTVPFVGVGIGMDLIQNLFGMVFISTVYYLRAKTEERHLMRFAEYRQYSLNIAQHGIFAKLGRVIDKALLRKQA
jgi:protein-S-isoprenylcysteine O-methyltransferase Ste14